MTSLIAPASTSTNSITNPNTIMPTTSTVSGLGTSFNYTFAGYSITVLTFTADSTADRRDGGRGKSDAGYGHID